MELLRITDFLNTLTIYIQTEKYSTSFDKYSND